MKRFLIILLAISMLVLASCGDSAIDNSVDVSSSESRLPQLDEVTINVIGTDKTKIEVEWTNNTDKEITYGMAYSVRYFENGEWVSCELKEEHCVHDIAMILEPGKSQSTIYETISDYDISKEGKYRFTTSFNFDEKEYYVSDDFENPFVTDDTNQKLDKTEELSFTAQYIRTDCRNESVDFPYVKLINSLSELNEYYESNKDVFYLGHVENVAADTTIGFLDAIEKYDDEFFATSSLALIVLEESSGSIRHEIKSIKYGGDSLDIIVNRLSDVAGTCDMASWHIIAELNGTKIDLKEENISLRVLQGRLESFGKEQVRFALEIFREAAKTSSKESVLVSPLSVSLALSMTANGADGNTLSEMLKLLCGDFDLERLNSENEYYLYLLASESNSNLNIANSIWIRNDGSINVDKKFVDAVNEIYSAEVFEKAFDTQTVSDINDWVDENTNGMIKKIIEEISDTTVMYLINALSFEADWKNIYYEDDIRKGKFYSANGETRDVEMMYSEESIYLKNDKAEGFIKPYKDKRFAFAAILPNEDIDFDEYVQALNEDELYELLLNSSKEHGNVILPKFTSEYSFNMNETLKSLGMVEAFDSDNADLTKLGSSVLGNLYIGKVLHKTFIQVDERGTKAGAATSVEIEAEGAIESGWTLKFDRPFIYMIIDTETNLPLFIGTLQDIN